MSFPKNFKSMLNRRLHPVLISILASLFVLSIASAPVAEELTTKKRLALSEDVREHCLKVLREGLHSDEFWPSIHAAEGLTLGGHGAEVIAYLTPKLANEKDDQSRCGIARELVRAGDRSQAKWMLDILDKDDPHGHVNAAESLYKVSETGDGLALRKAFVESDNVKLRLMAAAALGRHENSQAMRFLREKLRDEDPEVSRIAAWVLGRIGNSSDIRPLKQQAVSAPDALCRSYYEHSLAALGDADGLAALETNLADKDSAIRTAAATFAGDAWATSVASKLMRMLKDPHLDVRLRAAQSLLVLSQDPPTNRH